MLKKRKRNPISFLGWLGWIGVLGINTGDFLLQIFVIWFFFFLYSNMPADELFWNNVRKAGFRCFVIGTLWGNIVIIIIVIIKRVGETPHLVSLVTNVCFLGFYAILIFFIGSLIYYHEQDKRYLEDTND